MARIGVAPVKLLYLMVVALLAAAGLASGEDASRILVVPDHLHSSNDRAELEAFASACEAQGSFDLAAEVLQRVLTLAPDDVQLKVRLAEDSYKMGEAGKPEAFRHVNEVIAGGGLAGEWKHRALFLRGLMYFEQGLPDLARDDFAAVLAEATDFAPAAIGMSAVETARGDIVPASKRLDDAGAAIQPYDVETRYLLRVALQHFEKHRHVFKDSPENHGAYGKLLYRAGRLPEALMALRRAATEAANDTGLWNLVAAIAAQLGSAADAKAACEASLAINPEQPQIRSLLESLGATP